MSQNSDRKTHVHVNTKDMGVLFNEFSDFVQHLILGSFIQIIELRPLHNRRFTPLLGFGMFALVNLRRFYGPIFA